MARQSTGIVAICDGAKGIGRSHQLRRGADGADMKAKTTALVVDATDARFKHLYASESVYNLDTPFDWIPDSLKGIKGPTVPPPRF